MLDCQRMRFAINGFRSLAPIWSLIALEEWRRFEICCGCSTVATEQSPVSCSPSETFTDRDWLGRTKSIESWKSERLGNANRWRGIGRNAIQPFSKRLQFSGKPSKQI